MSETDPAPIDHARAARYQAEEGRNELSSGERVGEVSGQRLARAQVRAHLSQAEAMMALDERLNVLDVIAQALSTERPEDAYEYPRRTPTVAESLEHIANGVDRIAELLENR